MKTSKSDSWILIGNPENRRVGLFQDALKSQGSEPAIVVPWIDVLRKPDALDRLPEGPAIVRVDSAGEDFDVERELLLAGYDAACEAGVTTMPPDRVRELRPDRGRILCPRQHHLGFLAALARLGQLFKRRSSWRILNPPESVAELFDKRLTSRKYEALGIPVPPRLEPVRDLASLRARVREAGCGSAFVKLASGSSASCLAIYRQDPDDEHLVTTIEQASTGWYNTLKLQYIRKPERVNEVISFLLREGSQIEATVPKAKLGGQWFDCRVLVIAGEPAFVVVRQSAHEITNLHLGGSRGDLDALRAAVPKASWEAAMESCRKVWRAHRSFQVGVDLMFESDFSGHRVIEANAFGDLLPNLTRDGLSVYEWEIRAVATEKLAKQQSQPSPGK